jgi:hypothetical protein
MGTVAVRMGFVAAVVGLATPQIGHLWSFDELTSKADLVVIAECERTDETGLRTTHPNLNPDVPVVELATTFRIVAVLKPDSRAASAATSQVGLKHYRIDQAEWRRQHPPEPGFPPPGLVNAGSDLDLRSDAGPYLLFLRRGPRDLYEPLSGFTFPTDSVYQLRKVARGPG